MSAVNSSGEERTSIYPMRQSTNYTLPAEYYDVRGWEVIGENRQRIGRIDDLFIDTEDGEIRYLDVIMDPSIAQGKANYHLLLPVGIAEIDERDDLVWLRNVEVTTLMKLPVYEGQPLTRQYEETIQYLLKPDLVNTNYIGREFYTHAHFDRHRFYSARNPRPGQRGLGSMLHPFQ